MTIKNIWLSATKVFAGGASVLTYQAWLDSKNQTKILKEQSNELFKQNDTLDNIRKSVEGILDENVRNKLTAQVLECKEKVSEVTRTLGNLNNSKDNLFSQEDRLSFENAFNLHESGIINLNKTTTELLKILEDLNSKFNGDDINNIIENFKVYLSTLNTFELCVLFNIFISIFILFCLITIIVIYYGNFLINYFNLENKFPKLAKFIKIRHAFQEFYMLLYFSLIFISLIFMIYVNFVTFNL